MVQNIIIGILFYVGMMVLFSLFLQGWKKKKKAFNERREAEKYAQSYNDIKAQE